MIRRCAFVCVTALALVPYELVAQATKKRTPPPRILLFGDSSFGNLHNQVTRAFQGKAGVERSPLGYLDSGAALARLDEILGKEPWSLVCLNVGHSDMMFRDPRTKAVRAMSPAAGGVQAQPVEKHAANLEQIVRRIRAAGAKVVWVSTLPLPPGRGTGTLRPESVALYNTAAAKVMKRLRVAIVDVHAQIQAELAKVKNRRGLGRAYNQLMRKDLSKPMQRRIAAALGLELRKAPVKKEGRRAK